MIYEKPRLMALSLSGNDRLCGDCSQNGAANLLYKDPTGSFALALDRLVGDGDGTLDRSELNNVFASKEEGCSKYASTYCKFASAVTVAWS